MSVEAKLDGAVATITIARPDVRNAIDVETVLALRSALEQAVDGAARAVVLTGEGRAFCAGADLSFVRQAFEGDPEQVLGPLVDNLHATLKWMRSLPLAIVAAVEGAAAGAGLGLALAADARIVSRSAVFVTAYFAIGASPDGGVSYFLTRSIGAARTTELVMSNRPVRADEILALGLAEQLVDEGEALAAAQERAEQLASLPPLGLVRLRALVDAAPTQSIEQHLDAERAAIASLWPTADFREGIGAFLERRAPSFTGR